MCSAASKPPGPWRNNPVNAKHGGVLFKPVENAAVFLIADFIENKEKKRIMTAIMITLISRANQA